MEETHLPARELKVMLDSGRPVTVIDVREAEEYEAGHIPGALHIPGEALLSRMAEIPAGHLAVTY